MTIFPKRKSSPTLYWRAFLFLNIYKHGQCGVDVRKLEPTIATIKPKIRELRKLYRKNPKWFEMPKFVIKVY